MIKVRFKNGLMLAVLFIASGCGSSSGKQAAAGPTIGSTASCTYSEAMQCYEYYTPAAVQSNQSGCTDSSGTWSVNSACKKEGKVKGCQATVAGVKTYTFWTYDAEAGPAAIEAFCTAGNTQTSGTADVQMTVVTP